MSIFYDDIHYTLLSVEAVLSRLTQTMFTLEKYKSAFLDGIEEIDMLDKTESLTLYDVVETIQKGFVILTVSKELEISLAQIGKEGAHSIMQLNEINFGVRDELKEIMLDYSKTLPSIENIEEILDNSDNFIERGSVNKLTFSKLLGYEVHNASDLFDTTVQAKGIRFIKRIPRIPLNVAYKVGLKFGGFKNLIKANYNEIKEVEGIGDIRASMISNKINSYLRESR
jgi:diadenylate cyclase